MIRFVALKKLFLVAFGIFFSLALLEASLRLCGIFYLKSHAVSHAGNKEKTFDIVCIGDSFTMGNGNRKNSGSLLEKEEMYVSAGTVAPAL